MFWSLDLGEEVAVSSGSVRQRRPFAEPDAVRDDDIIHIWEERVFLSHDQVVQAVRAGLLHSLDEEFNIHRQVL